MEIRQEIGFWSQDNGGFGDGEGSVRMMEYWDLRGNWDELLVPIFEPGRINLRFSYQWKWNGDNCEAGRERSPLGFMPRVLRLHAQLPMASHHPHHGRDCKIIIPFIFFLFIHQNLKAKEALQCLHRKEN